MEGLVFRTNAAYQIIECSALASVERTALEAIVPDPECYGILRPTTTSGLTMKTVSRDVALLLYTLREPGPAPGYLSALLNPHEAEEVLRSLVLDGVLEVAGADDTFVTGADAALLLGGARPSGDNAGRLAALSMAALRHAAALPPSEPMAVAVQLYGYNSAPVTPQRSHVVFDDSSWAAYLGLSGGSCAALQDVWRAIPAARSPGWRSWSARSKALPRREASGLKLYLSPTFDALPETAVIAVEVFAAHRVGHFKIGATLQGLSRPDKIVAYFDTFDAMALVAADLDSALPSVVAQGVPFTAELARDGLISWGVDPARDSVRRTFAQESWRVWTTTRLAVNLVAARSAITEVDPVEFALRRMHDEGVDTNTWAPLSGFDE